MMSVVSNNLRGVARDKDYQQLPYAFDCPEYHETLAKRYRDVIEEIGEVSILVVSSGAGVTCIGLMKEHSPGPNLFDNYRKMFYTVYMSSDSTIRKKFQKEGFSICNEIVINESEYTFNDTRDGGWKKMIDESGLEIIKSNSLPTAWSFNQTTETPYIFTKFS